MKPGHLPAGVKVTHNAHDEHVYLNTPLTPTTLTVNEALELARQLVEHAGYAADA